MAMACNTTFGGLLDGMAFFSPHQLTYKLFQQNCQIERKNNFGYEESWRLEKSNQMNLCQKGGIFHLGQLGDQMEQKTLTS
jgi:hypothetical protein